MKKFYFIFLLKRSAIALFIALIFCSRLTAQAQITDQGKTAHRAVANSLPQNMDFYLWVNNNWATTKKYSYTYNAAGNVIISLEKDPVTNNPLFKDSSTFDTNNFKVYFERRSWTNNAWQTVSGFRITKSYNALGKVTEEKTEVIKSGLWTDSNKVLYSYNSNGKLIEIKKQTFTNGNFTDYEKTTYVFNSSGQLTENLYQAFLNNLWVAIYKYSYTYDLTGNIESKTNYLPLNNVLQPDIKEIYTYLFGDTLPNSVTFQSYTNGIWENDKREIDIIWRNYKSDIKVHYVLQDWEDSDSTWRDSERFTSVYSPNNSYVEIGEWLQGSSWEVHERTTKLYNFQGLEIQDKYEQIDFNNQWETQTNNEWIYSYSFNPDSAITERVQQQRDLNTPLHNVDRFVYYNFFQISGISDNHKALKISIYPNPATNFLNIELPTQASAKILLTDLTGRVVKTETLSTPNSRIDASALPKGIYLLSIQTEKGSQTSKIVKQ